MKSGKLTPFRIIFIVLTIAVMVIIFIFSSQDADISSDTSGGITEIVVRLAVKNYDSLSLAEQIEVYGKYDHIVRKLAHFTVYTALGFCCSLSFGKNIVKSEIIPLPDGVSCSFSVDRRKFLSRETLISICVCFLYACTDEFHQTFVPGRAGRFTDVLIDSSGGLTGIILSLIVLCIYYKIVKIEYFE